MKYWHELPQKKVDRLIKNKIIVSEILKKYKQPDWCNYPDALVGVMGCWSLISNEPNGVISRKFCSDCDSFIHG